MAPTTTLLVTRIDLHSFRSLEAALHKRRALHSPMQNPIVSTSQLVNRSSLTAPALPNPRYTDQLHAGSNSTLGNVRVRSRALATPGKDGTHLVDVVAVSTGGALRHESLVRPTLSNQVYSHRLHPRRLPRAGSLPRVRSTSSQLQPLERCEVS